MKDGKRVLVFGVIIIVVSIILMIIGANQTAAYMNSAAYQYDVMIYRLAGVSVIDIPVPGSLMTQIAISGILVGAALVISGVVLRFRGKKAAPYDALAEIRSE